MAGTGLSCSMSYLSRGDALTRRHAKTAKPWKRPSHVPVRGRQYIYAPPWHVSVPESNFPIRLAPSKPAELVPFQAGANTSLVVVPNRMIPSHSDPEPPDE